MKRYNPKEIEPRWQKVWADTQLYKATEQKDTPKSYVIDMFPYPSGAGLHVGHVRNYTISDTIAQFERQKGKNVLHAMGWDAFGLPAENYAIKTGIPPAESIKTNIGNFKAQLHKLGMSYDWSREINTTDPEYYRWTQWIFTKLHQKGLAYQQESLQWWCPVDMTVLANEQVESGKCWRCGNAVEKKSLKQWFFKITEYADALLDGIDDLVWPEKIKSMQRNWIGRSRGATVSFSVENSEDIIHVFTTRPDTLYGATFLVLAPEHPLVDTLTTQSQEAAVETYRKATLAKSDIDRMDTNREKTGAFTGRYAINPLNQQKVPIWIADYVLMGYGTGAIMAVPAHDERDHEFAQAFDLPIVRVVKNDTPDDECTHEEGVMINSGDFDGMRSEEAREEIVTRLKKDGLGEDTVQYKMRDWLISRQRYWGAPIPIIHCPEHGAVSVPEDQLPVVLPPVESYEPTGTGTSILASVEDWVNTTCPVCNKPAKRETDTMDGYACSSWYYLRYTDPHNTTQAWDPDKANYWMPIDFYCGGDHAVSHLLYSRFWMHFFADLGLIDATRKEPVGRLVYNGYINASDGTKMSKSKGNVINPDELIEQGYGADSLRLFELFIAPYDQGSNWNTHGVPGTYRFLQRYWTLSQEILAAPTQALEGQVSDKDILHAVHKAIRKVSTDLEALSFNTAIAGMMETMNDLYKLKANKGYAAHSDWLFAIRTFTQLLAPFAPHITEEIWSQLGNTSSVHVSGWPMWDDAMLVNDEITLVVQINGKVRAQLSVSAGSSEEHIITTAKSHPKVAEYLKGSTIKKTIYVPNKLISFVISA